MQKKLEPQLELLLLELEMQQDLELPPIRELVAEWKLELWWELLPMELEV